MAELSLEDARRLISEARDEADRNGWALAIAVVDGGGNLLSVDRMDGAPFGVTAIAIDKAHTAVAFGAPTDIWEESTKPGGANWGLHIALGGRMTVYPGGLPISIGDTVVGGVGVSGAAGAEDKQCAEAAVAAL